MKKDEPKEISNSPFGEGDDWRFNACVGPNGGPYGYLDYARGYFSAGHMICEQIFLKEGRSVDILIYPVLYIYRHAVELSLKHFLKNSERAVPGHHRLDQIWESVRKDISLLRLTKSERHLIQTLGNIIQNFSDFDPNSEAPRYPEDKGGSLFFQNRRIINIQPIYKDLKEFEKIIEFLSHLERNQS